MAAFLQPRIPSLLALLCIAGGYGMLFFANTSPTAENLVSCPFKFVTGIPCPGCGMGRATLALAQGSVVESLADHLFAIPFSLVLLVSFVWLCRDFVLAQSSFFAAARRPLSWQWQVVVFGVLLFSWVVNIVRGV